MGQKKSESGGGQKWVIFCSPKCGGGAKEWGKSADLELRGKKVGAKALILEQGAKEKGKNADF